MPTLPSNWPTTYPKVLEDKLGLKTQPQLVGVYTVTAKLYGDITWAAFRSDGNRRLPHFYVAQVTTDGVRPVDLYEIGAVGKNYETDLVVTSGLDSGTNRPLPLSRALKWNTHLPGQAKGKITDLPSDIKYADLCNAPAVGFDEAKGHCLTEITLNTGSADTYYLWVITYRQGTRGKPPFPPIEPDPALAAPLQDDDGSPPGGAPGGDEF